MPTAVQPITWLHMRMAKKKRQRSESFQVDQNEGNDARKRLAAFRAQMFDLPQEDCPIVSNETLQVLYKIKHKKHKKNVCAQDVMENGEGLPMVKLKRKKKKVNYVAKIEEEKETMKKQHNLRASMKTKTAQAEIIAMQVVQLHAKQTYNARKNEEADLLERATGQIDKSVRKTHKTMGGKTVAVSNMEKQKQNVKTAETESAVSVRTMASEGDCNERHKKRTKMKKRSRKQVAKKGMHEKAADDLAVTVDEDENNLVAVDKKADATYKKNGLTSGNVAAPSSTCSATQKRKSAKMATASSVSPNTQRPVIPRHKKPVIVTSEMQLVSDAAKCANKIAPTIAEIAPSMSARSVSTKAVLNHQTSTPVPLKPLTPMAASSAKTATMKNDTLLSTHENTSRWSPAESNCIEKAAMPHVSDDVSSDSEDDGELYVDHSSGDNTSLFSRLIDSAARERWELVEVGRLVRLFAAEWDFKESKTAQFLCNACPELVNVDFLEGLGVNLSSKQLVHVFETGSGSSSVFMNKIASAVENGFLSVRDPIFVSALERRVALMESNAEVMELLHPLLESLSTVRDVGYLLKHMCEHWQLERKIALVQEILLSSVFDDLDGNQDDILFDLPDLTGRLDFPSRLDQEDVDENGNLKGFLVNDDSDISDEEEPEKDGGGNDSENDENETDSEEEVEIQGRSWGRNQFIEDEADVGDEEDKEGCHAGNALSSSSNSD